MFKDFEVLEKLKIIKKKIFVERQINAEDYFRDYLKSKGITFKKLNGSPPGVPDFLCYFLTKNRKFYVEVKTGHDGINVNQINWLLQHPEEEVYIFILKQVIRKNPKRLKTDKKVCKVCLRFTEDFQKLDSGGYICSSCKGDRNGG